MKPDGLWFRLRKFQKIVIFVWRPAVYPPDHMGARTPKNVPHYSKIFGCPTIFVKCWGVVVWVDWKWLYSSWECKLFFKWFFPPLVFYDSHFCLLTHALKMKPDGLWFRLEKFLKIVIFVWWTSVSPPDHMGARTPKKCTPTIQKNSVARPFLWNVGEWWVQVTLH